VLGSGKIKGGEIQEEQQRREHGCWNLGGGLRGTEWESAFPLCESLLGNLARWAGGLVVPAHYVNCSNGASQRVTGTVRDLCQDVQKGVGQFR
jgi:hypothetical protein